jgi:hypothetical protein
MIFRKFRGSAIEAPIADPRKSFSPVPQGISFFTKWAFGGLNAHFAKLQQRTRHAESRRHSYRSQRVRLLPGAHPRDYSGRGSDEYGR